MLEVEGILNTEKNVISSLDFREKRPYKKTFFTSFIECKGILNEDTHKKLMMLNFLKKLIGGIGQKPDLKEIAKQGAIFIDVRNSNEFSSGNTPGTINIPLGEISSKIDKIRNYNKPIITCCVSGTRSGMAKTMLRAKGIDAYNGGRWQNMQALIEAQTKKNP